MDLTKLGWKNISTAYTEEEAINKIKSHPPDLAIVDILLDTNSDDYPVITLLYEMKIGFIIMTQFQNKEFYDVISKYSPLAYFSKPIDMIALKYTVEKFFENQYTNSINEISIFKSSPNHIFVKKGEKYIKVAFKDIIYLMAEGNYVNIQLNKNKFIIRSSLKKSINLLPNYQFIRIHRNYIVNRNKITEYNAQSSTITVHNTSLPVGRSYKSTLINSLNHLR